MLKLVVAPLLFVATAPAALALDMFAPEQHTKYAVVCAQVSCAGNADPGEKITIEVVSGGVVQGRKVLTADAKGQWHGNIKRLPAGWTHGEALVNARVGKSQKSVKIKFVD